MEMGSQLIVHFKSSNQKQFSENSVHRRRVEAIKNIEMKVLKTNIPENKVGTFSVLCCLDKLR